MDLSLLFSAPVALVIFIITIAASLYAFQNPHKAREWMLNPYSLLRHKRYYTVLTSGFIHADIQHLAFNMFTYFFFAFPLERYMVTLAQGPQGHLFFAIVYLLSMVLADMSTIFRHKNDPGYFSLGASGAISAVLFSFILFQPDARIGIFLLPFGIPAPLFAVLYVIYSVYSSRQRRDNVNHEAHLWGAVAGMLITIIFFPGILPYFIRQVGAMLGIGS